MDFDENTDWDGDIDSLSDEEFNALGEDVDFDGLEDSPMCVMCGREWGTSERADGQFYCGTCWQVWNS